MSTLEMTAIAAALHAGDRAAARRLLRPVLRATPSADAWVLAARASRDRQQAAVCLTHALALDPAHAEALRLQALLSRYEQPASVPETESSPGLPPLDVLVAPLPGTRPRRRRKRRISLLWLPAALVFTGLSLFALNAAGLISGIPTAVNQITGGPTPVLEWQGQALQDLPDPAAVLPAAVSRPLPAGEQGRNTDVLDPGYTHEYTFPAQPGSEVAIYIQFLSVSANQVSRNIAVLRPDGSNAIGTCQRDHILQGDNNLTLICPIDQGGVWQVRITGRSGQSTGAYFVGVEPM